MTKPLNHMRAVLCAAALAVAATFAMPVSGLAETGPVTDHSAVGELNFWNSIKESTDPKDLKLYLDEFPNGMFFDPAMQRYEQLTGQKPDTRSVDDNQGYASDDGSGTQAVVEPPPKPVAKPVTKKKAVSKTSKKKSTSATSKKKKATSKKSTKKKAVSSKKSKKKAVSKKKAASPKKVVVTKKPSCSAGSTDPACRDRGGGGGGGGSGGGGGWN